MSLGVANQVLRLHGLFVTCLLGAAIVLLPGCGSPYDSSPLATSPMTTSAGVNLPPGTLEPAAPPETGWPPGIAMVVLSTGYELHAVDRDGVRWKQEIQTETEANAATPFSGVTVSNNRQLIAYVEHRKDIVVRSLLDGAVISRTHYRAEGETYLNCISSDGEYAALAVVPLDLPEDACGNGPPWRVIVLDLRSGQVVPQQPVEGLVKQQTAADLRAEVNLNPLSWLPGHKLLVSAAGERSGAYVYDPVTGDMEPIPGIKLVFDVNDGGAVYGGSVDTAATPPKSGVWDGRSVEPLEPDADSAYASGGAFDLHGDALAVLVSDSHAEPLGWQLFRLSQGRWEPAGQLAENTWMKTCPAALSDDGTVAWTSLQRTNGELVLLSHDFQTGVWKEWLGPDSLPVHLDFYRFAAIVPGD